jgi:hypothetical protein
MKMAAIANAKDPLAALAFHPCLVLLRERKSTENQCQ